MLYKSLIRQITLNVLNVFHAISLYDVPVFPFRNVAVQHDSGYADYAAFCTSPNVFYHRLSPEQDKTKRRKQ
ncbi:hypothetical protein BH09BAC5_BH09BAC5_15660 [soil metagenome]